MHQEHVEPDYVVTLRDWVNQDVWEAISHTLLYPGDRTSPGQTPNHAAVERYLRCEGRYEDQAEYEVSEDTDSDSDEREATATRTTSGPRGYPSHFMNNQPCEEHEHITEQQRAALTTGIMQHMDVETDTNDDDEDSSMPPLVSVSGDEDERDDSDNDTDSSDAAGDDHGARGTIRLY